MKKLNLLLLMGLCLALIPAMTLAGDGVGACFVFGGEPVSSEGSSVPLDPDGGFAFVGCADGFTEAECESVDELVEYWEGATCDDLADEFSFSWDGSCDANIPPYGDVCIELSSELGVDGSELLCEEDVSGTFSAGVGCEGAPVPTTPPLGLAALMLLLLAGAVFLLTKRGARTAV